jgi:hypothetical protein
LALEGELAGNKFPFVVQIESTYRQPKPMISGCTATIIESRLLVTAAHCLVKSSPDPKSPGNYFEHQPIELKIKYVDPRNNKEQIIQAKNWFWNTGFSRNHFLWEQFVGPEEGRNHRWEAMSGADRRKVGYLAASSAVGDVAYIVPERPLRLSSYPNWIFNEVQPVKYLDGSLRWAMDNTKVPPLEAAFKQQFAGPGTAVVVGFGGTACKDAETQDRKGCTFDNKRRWAELKVLNYGWSELGRYNGFDVPLRDPWLWTLGRNDDKRPTIKGDSGGPVFMTNLANQLTLVGIDSQSSANFSVHPNPLTNPGLYWTAINSPGYRSLKL